MRRFLALAALSLAAACSPGANQPGGEAAPAAAIEADDGGERFYGARSFTIVYTLEGADAGTVTEHVRDWGRKRVEIKKSQIKFGPVVQNIDERTIFDHAKIVRIDATTGAITVQQNPVYDDVVAAMRGRSGPEVGEQFARALGGEPTGETGSFAGQSCTVWEFPQLATRSCVTDFGATLRASSAVGQFKTERVATDFRMGDGGPDEAFAYDESKATAGPDLEEAMERIKGL